MVTSLRKAFNAAFTQQKYQSFLTDLYSKHPGAIEFRVAETPVFVDKAFTHKMFDVCEHIIDLVCDPRFKQLTERAIPTGEFVQNETTHSQMIAFDFGICINDQGELEPQLIEMQGFPTLFAFQVYYPEVLEKHFSIPGNYTPYLGGYTKDSYIAMLKKLLLNGHNPENVILLEIKPHEQKTRIDFYCTEDYTGVKPVCISELTTEGRQLFYFRDGKKTRVKRIYNRIIFDDLKSRTDLGDIIDITQNWDVEWVPHPNWFYRISKFTLPFIYHPYVPKTFF